jgi:hypothetical protein
MVEPSSKTTINLNPFVPSRRSQFPIGTISPKIVSPLAKSREANAQSGSTVLSPDEQVNSVPGSWPRPVRGRFLGD